MLGFEPLVIDCGIFGAPLDIVRDISSDGVARLGGNSLSELQSTDTRGRAVAAMRTMLSNLTEQLCSGGQLHVPSGLGGRGCRHDGQRPGCATSPGCQRVVC